MVVAAGEAVAPGVVTPGEGIIEGAGIAVSGGMVAELVGDGVGSGAAVLLAQPASASASVPQRIIRIVLFKFYRLLSSLL
jgi:hypothetical protein